jgi:cytochrome P450
MSTVEQAPDVDLDFASPEFLRNPWPAYAALRARGAVHRSSASGFYFVLRHAEVRRALTDPRLTSDAPIRSDRELFGRSFMSTDGDEHRRIRRLLGRPFAPASVARQVDTVIRPVVNDVLDGLDLGATVDIVDAVAYEVPYRVVGTLLGVPEVDLRELYTLTRPLVAALELPRTRDSREGDASCALQDYFLELFASTSFRRAAVADAILKSSGRDRRACAGDLSFLLVAGTETSISAIANVIWALVGHPALLEQTWGNEHCVDPVVRETLRWEPPTHTVVRFATTRMEFAGVGIERWSPVLVSLASANRDESVFPTPDRWDPWRSAAEAVSFSAGQHMCLGQHLVQAELRVVLGELFRRFMPPELEGDLPVPVGHSYRRPRTLRVRLAHA